MRLCFLFIAVVTAAAGQAAAQCLPLAPVKAAPLGTSKTESPKSIVLIPDGQGGLKAICSMISKSRQVRVDATFASGPQVLGSVTSSNPVRDQFARAWYTPLLGGLLITGHRYGGLRVWDAALPNLPLRQLDFVNTTYCHEGVETYGNLLFYGESITNSTQSGGLKIYRIQSNPRGKLTLVGKWLKKNSSGEEVAVGPAGRTVWQWAFDFGTKNPLLMRRFDVSNPQQIQVVKSAPLPIPYCKSYGSKALELNEASHDTLLTALGWDGLWVVNPNTLAMTPVVRLCPKTQSAPGLFVRGASFVPGTDLALAWGFFRDGAGNATNVLVLFLVQRGVAVPIVFFCVPSLEIIDAEVHIGAHPGILFLVARQVDAKRNVVGPPVVARWPN